MSRSRIALAGALPLALLCSAAFAPAAGATEVRVEGTTVILEDTENNPDIAGLYYDSARGVRASNNQLRAGAGCQFDYAADGTVGAKCPGVVPTKLIARLGGPDLWSPVARGQVDNTLNLSTETGAPVEGVGGSGADFLTTDRSNPAKMRGGPGQDRIRTAGGADDLAGGPGPDDINAGAGNDTVYAGDDTKAKESPVYRDTIDCGPGKDTVYADPGDKLKGCETVKRIKPSANAEVVGVVTIGDQIVTGKAVSFEATCFTHQACNGAATLRKGKQKLGQKTFSIQPGKSKLVKIKLTAKGKKAVKKPGKLKARLAAKPLTGAPSEKTVTLK